MKLCFITPDYPDKTRSTFSFVKQLVDELKNKNHEIYIIAPFSLTNNRRWCAFKEQQCNITILRPKYISFSNIKFFGVEISSLFHRMTVKRCLNNLEWKPDIIYGHFWKSAYAGYDYAYKKNIPLFVATGESVINFKADIPKKRAFVDYISGIICVSTKNRDESIHLELEKNNSIIIPNAINEKLFHLKDKITLRDHYKIAHNDFVVCFVGWFNVRKGSDRLARALTLLKDESVKSFFIGDGPDVPKCSGIIYCGKVKHEQIPDYLNMADVFVLPTLKEGCCNAVIEAMACGLPIISSDLSFNWDLLDASNSILVDPNNVQEIASSILKLKNDKTLRAQLSSASLKKANSLTISSRANKIIEFIESKLRSKNNTEN